MIPGMFMQYVLALSFDSSAISLWFLWFQVQTVDLSSHVWCLPSGQCDLRILGWRWAPVVDWGRDNPGNVQSRVALRNYSPLYFCWGASVTTRGFVMRCMKLPYLTWIEFIHELEVTITAPVAWIWWYMLVSVIRWWWHSRRYRTDCALYPNFQTTIWFLCSRFHHSTHFLILIILRFHLNSAAGTRQLLKPGHRRNWLRDHG